MFVIVHEVCDAIVRVLMKKYIKFPSGNQLTEVLNGFERCHGFPQCVGAVDGTHIEILAPEDCTKDYYNHKDTILLYCKQLQTIATALLI